MNQLVARIRIAVRCAAGVLPSAALIIVAVSSLASDALANGRIIDRTLPEAFARAELADLVRLYDEHFRVPETGQYLDRLNLQKTRQTSPLSSIAATGVGLISLAIGDRIGVIDDAEAKAVRTLRVLLDGDDTTGFSALRSENGWFQHFINARTGKAIGKRKDRFSTIDTAILASGTVIAGNYFAAKATTLGTEGGSEVYDLARRLVMGISWKSAVKDVRKGRLHLIFDGSREEQEGRFFSIPFDEYVILSCLGEHVDRVMMDDSASSEFWNTHLAEVKELPMQSFQGHSVLAKHYGAFVPHFTHQFAFYFCGKLARDPYYRDEMVDTLNADRAWFRSAGEGAYEEHWWGLGAGSQIVFLEDGKRDPKHSYGAVAIHRNPHHNLSPAIMAGFLPLDRWKDRQPDGYRPVIGDLMSLVEQDQCRYNHVGLSFAWRCSAKSIDERVRFVEGIDLSTALFGYAAYLDEIGLEFFADFGI